MGYYLQAVIGRYDDLKKLTLPLTAKIVDLEKNIGVIPVSDELFDELGKGLASEKDPYSEFFWRLSSGVAQWIEALSQGIELAYIEAEYHGGTGDQSSIVWRDRKIFQKPQKGWGSINQALKVLGVIAASPDDEFDTVGLGRHRHLTDWLE